MFAAVTEEWQFMTASKPHLHAVSTSKPKMGKICIKMWPLAVRRKRGLNDMAKQRERVATDKLPVAFATVEQANSRGLLLCEIDVKLSLWKLCRRFIGVREIRASAATIKKDLLVICRTIRLLARTGRLWEAAVSAAACVNQPARQI